MNIEVQPGLVILGPVPTPQPTGGIIAVGSHADSPVRTVHAVHPETTKFSGISSGDHVIINPYSETQIEHGRTVVTIGDVLGRVSSASLGELEE